MALALNRYLCNSVLPLLTRHAHFLGEEGTGGGLFEATLQTAYRLSKCRSITNHQRDVVCEFLIALMQQIRPPMMTALLKKMSVDLRNLSREVSLGPNHHPIQCTNDWLLTFFNTTFSGNFHLIIGLQANQKGSDSKMFELLVQE